jgi:hypothetical protein
MDAAQGSRTARFAARSGKISMAAPELTDWSRPDASGSYAGDLSYAAGKWWEDPAREPDTGSWFPLSSSSDPLDQVPVQPGTLPQVLTQWTPAASDSQGLAPGVLAQNAAAGPHVLSAPQASSGNTGSYWLEGAAGAAVAAGLLEIARRRTAATRQAALANAGLAVPGSPQSASENARSMYEYIENTCDPAADDPATVTANGPAHDSEQYRYNARDCIHRR